MGTTTAMLEIGRQAPYFSLPALDGSPWQLAAAGMPLLLVFLETDCPTCRLALPYLQKLSSHLGGHPARVVGISQDAEAATRELVAQMSLEFPILLDLDLAVSRLYDPVAVPGFVLLDREGRIDLADIGFDKAALNAMAARLSRAAGVEPMTSTPEHFGSFIKSETVRYAKVIKDAGITPE